ncbi:hypothetical protein DYBT9623_02961 [Dyadobacter sp. CECT 9623]|uniref:Uncharacterized protein n=1 Tax=Dyadobacter linearis TaxID=2823330 RepID=A0ABN7R835_9BACT|nr:hypothetical protein [Dyadobacter sp. CECT 9623]CAG5070221.1 hypothetical protein DYBT9623_02961 [Dyadobacter sp. CECT 9623]
MKTKAQSKDKALPKGWTLNPSLDGKYAHLDLFREKFDRDNEFIRRVGLPDFMKSK